MGKQESERAADERTAIFATMVAAGLGQTYLGAWSSLAGRSLTWSRAAAAPFRTAVSFCATTVGSFWRRCNSSDVGGQGAELELGRGSLL